MVRTRFAPSPTGFMHVGNLRTALYEYLIAKSNNGKFILRIEDTDNARFVDGSIEVIYKSLKTAGLIHDEGPDIGGDYGPYTQSERKGIYSKYAATLIEKNKAYYCFCTKEDIEKRATTDTYIKYDRYCNTLTKDTVKEKLNSNISFVVRQLIPNGETTFYDEVYGDITVNNADLDDQILVKSDNFPTYNFANVVDDYLMSITHVVRGSEYLSSTPKYHLLYQAFEWDIPSYVHLPLIVDAYGEKLSKRNGAATFEDLLKLGYLPEAIINYIALLGWSKGNTEEFFTLEKLVKDFDIKGISKSPSSFDIMKLNWINEGYIKNMSEDDFFKLSLPYLKKRIQREDIDLKYVSSLVKTRVQITNEVVHLVDFIDHLDDYSCELYVHKKMKTTTEMSLKVLELALPMLEALPSWSSKTVADCLVTIIEDLGVKNGQVLWPIRTALSGKPYSPCGGAELAQILGKEESIFRIKSGIEILKK
jgi:glutamyl-tRNA synthetase